MSHHGEGTARRGAGHMRIACKDHPANPQFSSKSHVETVTGEILHVDGGQSAGR